MRLKLSGMRANPPFAPSTKAESVAFNPPFACIAWSPYAGYIPKPAPAKQPQVTLRHPRTSHISLGAAA